MPSSFVVLFERVAPQASSAAHNAYDDLKNVYIYIQMRMVQGSMCECEVTLIRHVDFTVRYKWYCLDRQEEMC